MLRRDLIGVRGRDRTKRVDKQLEDSSVSLTTENKENNCSKSFSDKRLRSTKSLETLNGIIDVDDMFHDLNHRRQLDVNRLDNGFKVSDRTRVDINNDCLKYNAECIYDETTRINAAGLKHSDEYGNLGRGNRDLSLRRTFSQDSSRPFKENENSLQFNINVPYIPSWIGYHRGSSNMDLNSMRNLGILPKGLSMSLTDLRPEGRVSMKQSRDILHNLQHQQQQHEMNPGTKHEEMEREYLRLKRTLKQKQRTDLTPGDIHYNNSDVIANTHARANISDTMLPHYKELMESDELGINHFRKHIHNVKINSKRHKRALKLVETATNRVGPFHTNRRNLKFKPLYEQKHSEDAPSDDIRSKIGGSRS